jgi:molybdate transport system ATP-binding protein
MSLILRGRVAFDRFLLDVDLQAAAGEVVALVGPNGSGKSTTLASVAGLQRLSDGRLKLDGAVLDDPQAGHWVPPHARRIGYLPQHLELFPHLNSLDNVAYGLRRRGLGRRAARARAWRWLDRLDIGDLASARPQTLSGGQAQRVALARALAFEPRVLLLDEPMSALDAQVRMSVLSRLQRLVKGFDGVTLLVTHDLLDVFGLADRVVVLDAGRIAQDIAPEQLCRHPRTRHAAAMTGRNLIPGWARGHDVDLGHGIVLITTRRHEGPVDLVCPPRAVRLAPRHDDRPPGAWESTIAGVETVGDHARALLGSPLPLMARIRLEDLAMDLTQDARVWAWLDLAEVDIHLCDPPPSITGSPGIPVAAPAAVDCVGDAQVPQSQQREAASSRSR